MKSIAAKWYECTARFEKQKDDGTLAFVKETYALDAVTFAEAEERLAEELAPFYGPVEAVAIKTASYSEVIFTDKDDEDKWYKTKVAFITLDKMTNKERRTVSTYLVQASSADNAIHNMHAFMDGSVADYVNISVTETKIVEVYKPKDR